MLEYVHTPIALRYRMRESQYLASRDITNTGMAVIIDCGEYDNIHPLDKQTVGFRLALQALKKVYSVKIDADGPVFARAEVEGALPCVFILITPNVVLSFAEKTPASKLPVKKGLIFPHGRRLTAMT